MAVWIAHSNNTEHQNYTISNHENTIHTCDGDNSYGKSVMIIIWWICQCVLRAGLCSLCLRGSKRLRL